MRGPACLSLVLLLLGSSAADAQVVRGRLVDAESGRPLEGAMVVLEGPLGDVASVLSDALGRFVVRAPEVGTYALRADRIGHASARLEPFTLTAADTLDVRLTAPVSPVLLEGLEVSGERRCAVLPEAGKAVATVWGEARKALAAAALTEDSDVYQYRTVGFVRELDQRGRRVLSEQRRVGRSYQRAPFESLPADQLVDEGFVRPDPEGDLYYAPDAAVLLSDAFLQTHCLNLTRGGGEAEELLGVLFEPLEGRTQPDIRGTVWLDPSSGELRRVDYAYENIDPALRNDAVGGRVAFQGLPDGTWIVTEWRIRMPTASLAPDYRGGRQLVLTGIREVGGEVAQVRDQGGATILEAERATLAGVVVDETGETPVAAASVTLVGTRTAALTDSTGAFRIAGLPEGVYGVTFAAPGLPVLEGVPEPVEVSLERGSVTSVRLTAPPLAAVLDAACGEAERPEGSAVLGGTVVDEEGGEPLANATVRILWTGYRFRGTTVQRGRQAEVSALIGAAGDGLQTVADDRGRYLLCGIPAGHPLRLEAEAGDLVSATLDVRVPAGTPFLEQDVPIVASGTGALQGIAIAMEDMEPLEGARVRLEGVGTSSTDESGRFDFENVPQGRYVLRTEMPERRDVVDTVRIRPGGTLRLEVRLPPAAMAIEGLTVEVFSRAELDVRGDPFTGATLDRLTPVELEALRVRVRDMVDVVRTLGSPRIRISEVGPQGFPVAFCVRWTRQIPSIRQQQGGSGCPSMLIVVDGRPIGGGPQDAGGSRRVLPASALALSLNPDDIESVTVLSPVQAEFRYGIDGGYGALVIETRRGGRDGAG